MTFICLCFPPEVMAKRYLLKCYDNACNLIIIILSVVACILFALFLTKSDYNIARIFT